MTNSIRILFKLTAILIFTNFAITAFHLALDVLLPFAWVLILDPLLRMAIASPLILFLVIKPYVMDQEENEMLLQKARELTKRLHLEKEKILLSEQKDLQQEINKAIAKLKDSEQRYILAAKAANDGLWDWNLEENKIFFSERFCEIMHAEDPINTADQWFSLIHVSDLVKFLKTIESSRTNSKETKYEFEHRTQNDEWILTRWINVVNEMGRVVRLVGSISNVSKRRQYQEKLQYDAFHDSLTGLANRALFQDRLQHSILKFKRSFYAPFALLFVDFDDFKEINDTLGHNIGDEALKYAAKLLKNAVRGTDTVARLGGDEFAIIIEEMDDKELLMQLINRIFAGVSHPIKVDEHEIKISFSIGCLHANEQIPAYDTYTEALRDADTALYSAKKDGKGRCAFFDTTMRLESSRIFNLSRSLYDAIDKNEVFVVYQPIISMMNLQTAGFEALVRWNHPEYGLIPPNQFIPIAENNGLIGKLGMFVFDVACRQLKKWQEQFQRDDLFMSINVSGRQIEDVRLVENFLDIIKKSNLNPRTVHLEITESTIWDNSKTAKLFNQNIRNAGIHLAIDDFGTGYSSLSMLNNFAFDVLKIDKSFIDNIMTQAKARDMVRMIQSLAKSLNMDIVAEGIESENQFHWLQQTDCDFLQGYLFSKPQNAEAINDIMDFNQQYRQVI